MDTSTIISIILAVIAIFLSVWFFIESNKQNKDTALLQIEIKNAIEKLEQLYNRTYTDTFGALKTQLSVMQEHIFHSSVGDTNTSEPNNLRFSILGCITEKKILTFDELCTHVTGFKKSDIQETVYCIHRDRIIHFDGKKIEYIKQNITQNIEGQG
jgi:hypothetical protein